MNHSHSGHEFDGRHGDSIGKRGNKRRKSRSVQQSAKYEKTYQPLEAFEYLMATKYNEVGKTVKVRFHLKKLETVTKGLDNLTNSIIKLTLK